MEWIDVRKDSPQEYEEVLITVILGNHFVNSVEFAIYRNGNYYTPNFEECFNGVIAFMKKPRASDIQGIV